MRPVLVLGVPRSGTTWVAEVLAAAGGATYLEEPDNHFRFAFAFRAKRVLGGRDYPLLRPDAAGDRVADYERLWAEAFAPAQSTPAGLPSIRRRVTNRLIRASGSKRVAQALAGEGRGSAVLASAAVLAVPERAVGGATSLVVKSVYAPLAAEWLASRWPAEIVVVQRNPLSVLSSWIHLGWLDPAAPDALGTLDPAAGAELAAAFDVPPPPNRPLARAAWLIGALSCALDEAAQRSPSWQQVRHEDLCAAPHDSFAALAARVGLEWSPAGDRLLDAMNRPGERYETARLSSDLPDVWRRRLDDDQVAEIRGVLERFPLVAGM